MQNSNVNCTARSTQYRHQFLQRRCGTKLVTKRRCTMLTKQTAYIVISNLTHILQTSLFTFVSRRALAFEKDRLIEPGHSQTGHSFLFREQSFPPRTIASDEFIFVLLAEIKLLRQIYAIVLCVEGEFGKTFSDFISRYPPGMKSTSAETVTDRLN